MDGLSEVGFENPRPLTGPELESGALDHSAILTTHCAFLDWFERGIYHSVYGCLNVSQVGAFKNCEADDGT